MATVEKYMSNDGAEVRQHYNILPNIQMRMKTSATARAMVMTAKTRKPMNEPRAGYATRQQKKLSVQQAMRAWSMTHLIGSLDTCARRTSPWSIEGRDNPSVKQVDVLLNCILRALFFDFVTGRTTPIFP